MTEHRMRRLVVMTVALMAMSVGTTACDDEPTPPTTPPAADQRVPAFPGLYLTGPVTVLPAEPAGLRIVSARPCSDLTAMLAAGQWRIVDQMVVPDNEGSAFAAGFGLVPALVLGREDRLIFATFAGSTDCSALVTDLPRQTITMTGKSLPGATEGWIGTTGCVSYPDGKGFQVSLYFDTDARTGGILRFFLTPKDGGYVMDTEESSTFSAMLVSHKSRFLQVYSGFYTAMLQQREDAKPPAGVTIHALDPGETFTVKPTINQEGLLPHGEIVMTGLVDEMTGAQVSLSLPFNCRDHKTM